MPKKLYFPKDELAHQSVIEWWYFNGNLSDHSQNQYAYMPEPWAGYLPAWFTNLLPLSAELYLKFQGAGEFLLMLSFLSGVGLPWTALLASAEFAGILLFYGIDLVSFRDIALLGGALSLFFLTYQSEESSQNK